MAALHDRDSAGSAVDAAPRYAATWWWTVGDAELIASTHSSEQPTARRRADDSGLA